MKRKKQRKRKKINKRNLIYMSVTADEYELPICITDTVEELAAIYGITRDTIYSAISLNKNGKRNGYKFVKVKKIKHRSRINDR